MLRTDLALALDMRVRWGSLCFRLGVPDSAGAWEFISDMYMNPLREYHTLTHVHRCLSLFDDQCFEDRLAEKMDPYEIDVIEASLILHDVIYDARSNQNELDSSRVAHMLFKWSDHVLDIQRAVMFTLHDRQPESTVQAIVMDIDLAGLGAPRDVFVEDCKNVRKEYDFVPHEDFWKARRRIMMTFLDRARMERLYYTEYWNKRLNEQAEANLDTHVSACTINLTSGDENAW